MLHFKYVFNLYYIILFIYMHIYSKYKLRKSFNGLVYPSSIWFVVSVLFSLILEYLLSNMVLHLIVFFAFSG